MENNEKKYTPINLATTHTNVKYKCSTCNEFVSNQIAKKIGGNWKYFCKKCKRWE